MHETGRFVHIFDCHLRLLIVFFKPFIDLKILWFNALLLLMFGARLLVRPVFEVVDNHRNIGSRVTKYSGVLKLRRH